MLNPYSFEWPYHSKKSVPSVLSVKGKKVLHIDRNDHYGGFVAFQSCTQVIQYSQYAVKLLL